MNLSVIEAMKLKAAKNFRFKGIEFAGFEDISTTEIEESLKNFDTVPEIYEDDEQIDIWANLVLRYEGEPPDSYRVLNSMIMDWVDANDKQIKKILNPELSDFLKDKYPEIDLSDLNEDFDDYIWEDQVDYYPEIDEDDKKINFVIELVLDIEVSEE